MTDKNTQPITAREAAIIHLGDSYPWRSEISTKQVWAVRHGLFEYSEPLATAQVRSMVKYGMYHHINGNVTPLMRDVNDIVIKNQPFPSPFPRGCAPIAVVVDAMSSDGQTIIEIKSEGQTSMSYPVNRWADSGAAINSWQDCSQVGGRQADDSPIFTKGMIPVEAYWEVQAKMLCYNASIAKLKGKSKPAVVTGALLMVYLPGLEEPLRQYRIAVNTVDQESLEDSVQAFYDAHIAGDEPVPEIPKASPETRTSAEVTNQFMGQLQSRWNASQEADQNSKVAKESLKKVLEKMSDEYGVHNEYVSPDSRSVSRNTYMVHLKPKLDPKPYSRTDTKYSWAKG